MGTLTTALTIRYLEDIEPELQRHGTRSGQIPLLLIPDPIIRYLASIRRPFSDGSL